MESAAVTRETVSVGFGERFVALLIDVIIVGIAGAVARAISSTGLGVAVSLVIGVAYYTYFWSSTGQTLGKMAMNLKVVKADGSGLVDIGGGLSVTLATSSLASRFSSATSGCSGTVSTTPGTTRSPARR